MRGIHRPNRALRLAAGIVVVLLLAGVAFLVWPSSPMMHGVAYFPRTIHLFAGSDVDVLGVRIGSVDSVTPQPNAVRVTFSYEAKYKIPANAYAVIIEPTLVADRAVQLTPVYRGGKTLADHGVIPLARTSVPVELDDFTREVDQLAVALGPKGANKSGALTRLVNVGAANLKGEGKAANTTMSQVSRLMQTLGDNREALFGTVANLQQFTTQLAQHDAQTRAFMGDLSQVSAQLDDEKAALGAALRNLAVALDEVRAFVRKNRHALANSVQSLDGVTTVLAKERLLIGRFMDMGGVGVDNYSHLYTPSARTYNARFDFTYQQSNPALFACQLLGAAGASDTECLKLLRSLKVLDHLPVGSGAKK